MKRNIFENNRELINIRFPALAEIIHVPDHSSGISVIISKSGVPVPLISSEGREISAHSRFDPLKEAERFAGGITDFDRDLFVVFGLGFAYHIEEILKKIPSEAAMIIIEKDITMLARAAEARDLSAVLSDKRVSILIDPGHEEISGALSSISSNRVSFITHRGSYQIDPSYYNRALDTAKSSVSTKEVNIATLAKFENLWASNIIRNTPAFISNPGINIFFNRFEGIPGILCAAGPSLYECLPRLNEIKNRVLIVAVDTAYRILLKHGIIPHFCVSVDPQVINARYFEGCRETQTLLAADPTVHPSVFRMFTGKKAVSGIVFDAMKWIEGFTGEKGDTAHGGSVSTNAYDFLKRLGASPVVMLGQDLAFTGGYAHCRGSYLDDQIHLRSTRFKTVHSFNRFQQTALPGIYVKGIRSPKLRTNRKMTIFASWFERRADGDLVNASPDGALIPGVKHISFGDINFPVNDLDLFNKIHEIHSEASAKSEKNITAPVAKRAFEIHRELDSIMPHLAKAAALSGELVSLVKNPAANGKKIDSILGTLTAVDKTIESKKSIKEIIGFTSQKVIHTITEGYDIEENEKNMTDEEKTALRSKYLYEGLLRGTKANRRLFRKLSLLADS